MRTQFIPGSRHFAKKQCPWAEHITKVAGGYMCFESIQDFKTWKNQKMSATKYQVSYLAGKDRILFPCTCINAAMFHFRVLVKTLKDSGKYGHVYFKSVWRRTSVLSKEEFDSILPDDLEFLEANGCLIRHCMPVFKSTQYMIAFTFDPELQ